MLLFFCVALHLQDLHERLNMRKRLHAGQIMSLLDASVEPEARQGLNTEL